MLVFSESCIDFGVASGLHAVLFGFCLNLAVHLGRSPTSHSYDYASAGDQPTCFASLT